MSRSKSSWSRKSGFTLIELLVVIAIIAILAAILFPVFMVAKEKGRETSCASNMKQIGIGFQQYLSDWNDQFGYMMWKQPPSDGSGDFTRGIGLGTKHWSDEIYPYLKNKKVVSCPSHKFPKVVTDNIPEAERWWMGYAVNRWLHAPDGSWDTYVRMSQIEKPTKTLMVTEQRQALNIPPYYDWANYYDIPYGRWPRVSNTDPPGRYKPDVRHRGGSNFTFIDGHVKWMTPDATVSPELFWDISPTIP